MEERGYHPPDVDEAAEDYGDWNADLESSDPARLEKYYGTEAASRWVEAVQRREEYDYYEGPVEPGPGWTNPPGRSDAPPPVLGPPISAYEPFAQLSSDDQALLAQLDFDYATWQRISRTTYLRPPQAFVAWVRGGGRNPEDLWSWGRERRRHPFSEWAQVPLLNAREAARYEAAKIVPAVAARWIALGLRKPSDILSAEASLSTSDYEAWRDHGVPDLATILRLRRSFADPGRMDEWRAAGWTDPAAVADAAERGVARETLRELQATGLNEFDAQRCAASLVTAQQVRKLLAGWPAPTPDSSIVADVALGGATPTLLAEFSAVGMMTGEPFTDVEIRQLVRSALSPRAIALSLMANEPVSCRGARRISTVGTIEVEGRVQVAVELAHAPSPSRARKVLRACLDENGISRVSGSLIVALSKDFLRFSPDELREWLGDRTIASESEVDEWVRPWTRWSTPSPVSKLCIRGGASSEAASCRKDPGGGAPSVSGVGRFDSPVRCSFCGKSQAQVAKMVPGPGVFVCNECVVLLYDVVNDEHGGAGASVTRQTASEAIKRAADALDSLAEDLREAAGKIPEESSDGTAL